MSWGTDERSSLDSWLAEVDRLLIEPGDGDRGVGKVYAIVAKERDLQLHIRVGWLAGTEFVTLADWVPSDGRYDTELLIERRLLPELIGELRRLEKYLGG